MTNVLDEIGVFSDISTYLHFRNYQPEFLLCFKRFSFCNSSQEPNLFWNSVSECKQMGKTEPRRKLNKKRKWLLMILLSVQHMS